MEIRRYLSIIRRWLLLIVLIVVAAVAAGWLIAPRGRSYSATSILYVGSRSIDISPTSGEVSGERVAGLDRLIATFTALVPTRPVAQAAQASAQVARNPDQIIAHTTAKQIANTDLIAITYTDSDAARTQRVDNALSRALVDQIRAFEPATAAHEQVLSVYQPATLPGAPNHSDLARYLILAGLFGLIVAGCAIALLEYLDITVRSAEDAERQLELPVLGVVPALGAALPVRTTTSARTGLRPGPSPSPSTGAPT